MSRPDVAFTLAGEERAPVTWAAALPGAPGRLARLADILGAGFPRQRGRGACGERNGVAVEGFAALPTLTRANALGQYLFVNGRPVRDKLLIGVVRGAYADYLPRDRHPIVALFVTLRAARGRRQCASRQGRGALPRSAALCARCSITRLQQALAREGQRAATTGGSATVAALPPGRGAAAAAGIGGARRRGPIRAATPWPTQRQRCARLCGGRAGSLRRRRAIGRCASTIAEPRARTCIDRPLGAARAQVHETYIVAQTRDRHRDRRPARRA